LRQRSTRSLASGSAPHHWNPRQPVELAPRCLAGEDGIHRVTLNATNRRGAPVRCRVTLASLGGDALPSAGATLVVDQLTGGEK
jgi:hypothetical protein